MTKQDSSGYTFDAIGREPIDAPATLSLSGTTYAVADLVDRCESFHRHRRKSHANWKKKFVARDQNLMALHWLRMALHALVNFDEELAAADVSAGEHEPRIDLGELASGSVPSSTENTKPAATDAPAVADRTYQSTDFSGLFSFGPNTVAGCGG